MNPIFVVFLCLLSASVVMLINYAMGYYDSNPSQKDLLRIMYQLGMPSSFELTVQPMPVYIVNLSTCLHRKVFMISQLRNPFIEASVNLVFIKAMDAKKMTISAPNVVTTNSTEIHLGHGYTSSWTLSELACTVSHLQAIRQAWEDNCQFCVVAEDDASFSLVQHWPLTLHQLTTHLPHTQPGIISLFNPETSSAKELLIRGIPKWGTQAYLINRAAMEMVQSACFPTAYKVNIPYLKAIKIPVADYFIYNFIPNCSVVTRSYIFPMNVDLPSTLHDAHTERHLRAAVKAIQHATNQKTDLEMIRAYELPR